MKLYIKQKVFSWRERFFIKDETGRDKYSAEGEIFSWGRKLHIYNANGEEVAFIKQKMFTFLPRYYIEIGSNTYTIVKEFSFFRPRFRIEGLAWTMEGDFLAHEYTLNDNTGTVMNISKHWFTWGDSYELDINNTKDELTCLCVALTIDCMQADSSSHSHSSH
jgi:uncharacterized protein YxjI